MSCLLIVFNSFFAKNATLCAALMVRTTTIYRFTKTVSSQPPNVLQYGVETPVCK